MGSSTSASEAQATETSTTTANDVTTSTTASDATQGETIKAQPPLQIIITYDISNQCGVLDDGEDADEVKSAVSKNVLGHINDGTFATEIPSDTLVCPMEGMSTVIVRVAHDGA